MPYPGTMATLLAAARIAAASSALALRTVRASSAPFAASLHLPKRAEHHVGERAVHGLAHDHRENEAGGAVERARDDQHFAVQHESQQRGGKSGIGIQQRNHRGHVRAADRRHQQNSKQQRDHHHDREEHRVRRIDHQRDRQQQRRAQHGKADDILPFINDRPLRKNFLQLSGGDHAAGERERADDHFEADFAHAEPRDVRHAHVIFGDSDHGSGKRAEGVAQRGSLRHGGHLHHAEGNADGRADDQRDDDPLVLGEFRIRERGANGQRRGNFSRQHAAPRAGRRAEPLDRQNEENGGDDVRAVDELLRGDRVHDFFGVCRS